MKATAHEKLTHLKSNGFLEFMDDEHGAFLCETTPDNLIRNVVFISTHQTDMRLSS
jgi:hypothetical protein